MKRTLDDSTSASNSSNKKTRHALRAFVLHEVQDISASVVDLYLDLSSLANLTASSWTLRKQYDLGAAPSLWKQLRPEKPTALISNPRMTATAAQKLQTIFKFTAREIRGSAEVILPTAANTGDYQLAEWFCNVFGTAGLIGMSSTYEKTCLVLNLFNLVRVGCSRGHVGFVAWIVEHFDLRMDGSGDWLQLFRGAVGSGSVSMMDWVYSNRPKIVDTRRSLIFTRVTEVHSAQNFSMQQLCRSNNIDAIRWALAAFNYSQERINRTIKNCFLLGYRVGVIHYLLRTPLGRGPEAEDVRRFYDLLSDGDRERVGELPDEPEDSVFDPESALDMALLPPLAPGGD